MRILLLNPPNREALPNEASSAAQEGSGQYPPLGLLHLQAAAEQSGHCADILDLNLPGRSLDDYQEDAQAVGITALTPNLVSVAHTAALAKVRYPKAKVIIGGPHTDIYPKQTAALPNVDFVMIGEGEETFPALLTELEKKNEAPEVTGVGYINDGQYLGSLERAYPMDLDALPCPDRSRIDFKAYRGLAGEDVTFTTLITCRGCPHRCAFCSTPRGKVRRRSVESILDEAARCVSLGIEHLYFVDDTFPVTEERLEPLCEGLSNLFPRPKWSCRTAAAGLTEKGMHLLKNAGCERVQIGVETGTDEGLKILRKPATIAKIRETFENARKVGLPTMAYFMIGLPHEKSPADISKTVSFSIGLKPDFAMYNVLTLYPNTELFHQAEAKGLVERGAWDSFASAPDANFKPPLWEEHMTGRQLFNLQAKAYRSFYMRPGMIWRQLMAPGGLGSFWRKAKVAAKMLFSGGAA